MPETATPRSYKVGVKTSGDRDWAYNGLRFATQEAAQTYGRDLSWRWTAVREVQITASDDAPTEKESQMYVNLDAYIADIPHLVDQGAERLTKEFGSPRAWAERIEKERLDLSSDHSCVLGQLYEDKAPKYDSGYRWGYVHLFPEVGYDYVYSEDSPVIQHGFAVPDKAGDFEMGTEEQDDLYEILQEAWERKLDEILGSGE